MTTSKPSKGVSKVKRQMNKIRRWKPKEEDGRIVKELSSLLEAHGEKILLGGTTLCLTTQVLASLNRQFNQLTEGNSYQTYQVADGCTANSEIAFLFDFIQRVPQLKVTSGPVCSPSPYLNISYFKQVCYLEIKRIPVCYIKGLSFLRRQIKSLVCARSTNDIKTVIYQFGLEGPNLFALTELETLDLSYNTIRNIDDSVKLLPSLKRLNLSHNCLKTAELEDLPAINILNLGFNSISHVPTCTPSIANRLTTISLRNNNLMNLEGIQNYTCLKCLDVSGNCIASFYDLAPLAQLQWLVNINLVGNPLVFMQDYRVNAVAKLCPLTRKEEIYLDGKPLNSMELMNLGRDVEPVSLRAYIPSQPIGRPSGSLRELARSLHELSQSEGSQKSGHIRQRTIKKSCKRKQRRYREAQIIDPNNHNVPRTSTPDPPNSFQNKPIFSNIDRIVSRRSSTDDSVVWVPQVRNNGSGVQGAVSALEYTSFGESSSSCTDENSEVNNDANSNGQKIQSLTTSMIGSENKDESRPPSSLGGRVTPYQCGNSGIYSSVPTNLNSICSNDTGSVTSLDNLSDGEDEEIYLVQSVVFNAKDRYGREEKESVFLIIRRPYIVEKDPFRGAVLHRLDLNFLQNLTFHTLDPLRVSLRFNLIRQDRKERVYVFEDPDNLQAFIKILRPIVQENQDQEFAKMIHYQCLKCSSEFVTAESTESLALCPTCGSGLVVEKEVESDIVEKDIVDQKDYHLSGYTDNDNTEPNIKNTDESTDIPRSSSIAIILPFEDNKNCKCGSLPNSFVIHGKNGKLSSGSVEKEISTTSCSCPKAYTLNLEREYKVQSAMDTSLDHSSLNGSRTSLALKGSEEICSENDVSRSSSPFIERVENVSRQSDSRSSPISRTITDVSYQPCFNSNTSIEKKANRRVVWNKDEFKKLDHRVKLHLVLNVFQYDTEEIVCYLKSSCCFGGKDEVFDCLLLMTRAYVYIFKVTESKSEIPGNFLVKIARYKVNELKFIDYGYYSQSFQLDFGGDMGLYKFLVRDPTRCERFLAVLLRNIECVFNNYVVPVLNEDANPETVANLRCQVFGEKEGPQVLGYRLFIQATEFCVPSILDSKKVRMRTHESCFVVRDFVDWLIARRTVTSKSEGVDLLQNLLKASVIQPISKDGQLSYNDAIYKFGNVEALKAASEEELAKTNCTENGYLSDDDDEDEEDNTVELYQLHLIGIEQKDTTLLPRTLIMTKTLLYVVDECHQWPLSRLSLPPAHLRDQFSKVDTQKITNTTKLELCEKDPCFMKINFVDECSDDGPTETSWVIKSETSDTLDVLVTAVRDHWKQQFTINLPFDILLELRTSLVKYRDM